MYVFVSRDYKSNPLTSVAWTFDAPGRPVGDASWPDNRSGLVYSSLPVLDPSSAIENTVGRSERMLPLPGSTHAVHRMATHPSHSHTVADRAYRNLTTSTTATENQRLYSAITPQRLSFSQNRFAENGSFQCQQAGCEKSFKTEWSLTRHKRRYRDSVHFARAQC
jgi:hypothetical protein